MTLVLEKPTYNHLLTGDGLPLFKPIEFKLTARIDQNLSLKSVNNTNISLNLTPQTHALTSTDAQIIDTSWDKVAKIGPGLHNAGNTCFMNSVLQAVAYTAPFTKYLLSKQHSAQCKQKEKSILFCALCAFERHIKLCFTTGAKAVEPNEILKNIKHINKKYRIGRQEDAHEFLRDLMESFQKSCLNFIDKPTPQLMESTIITKIFGGKLKSTVECLSCNYKSEVYENFFDLSLDLNKSDSVEKCLEGFFQPEYLKGANKYRCSSCKKLVEAKKQFSIFKRPLVLTIHLKRFDNMFTRINKITKHVRFPNSIKINQYLCNKSRPEAAEYDLNALIIHQGHGCSSGHYYAFVKNSNSQWYQMNDSFVTNSKMDVVLKQNGYILFFVLKPSALGRLATMKESPSLNGHAASTEIPILNSMSTPKEKLQHTVKTLLNVGLLTNGKNGPKDTVILNSKISTEIPLANGKPAASLLNGKIVQELTNGKTVVPQASKPILERLTSKELTPTSKVPTSTDPPTLRELAKTLVRNSSKEFPMLNNRSNSINLTSLLPTKDNKTPKDKTHMFTDLFNTIDSKIAPNSLSTIKSSSKSQNSDVNNGLINGATISNSIPTDTSMQGKSYTSILESLKNSLEYRGYISKVEHEFSKPTNGLSLRRSMSELPSKPLNLPLLSPVLKKSISLTMEPLESTAVKIPKFSFRVNKLSKLKRLNSKVGISFQNKKLKTENNSSLTVVNKMEIEEDNISVEEKNPKFNSRIEQWDMDLSQDLLNKRMKTIRENKKLFTVERKVKDEYDWEYDKGKLKKEKKKKWYIPKNDFQSVYDNYKSSQTPYN
jgi:ubiquitin C-terminal hydrolase